MCRDPDNMDHADMDGAVDRGGGGKREMVAVGVFEVDGGALVVVVVCCYNTPSNLFYSIFPS